MMDIDFDECDGCDETYCVNCWKKELRKKQEQKEMSKFEECLSYFVKRGSKVEIKQNGQFVDYKPVCERRGENNENDSLKPDDASYTPLLERMDSPD